jgi:hypothetical protein
MLEAKYSTIKVGVSTSKLMTKTQFQAAESSLTVAELFTQLEGEDADDIFAFDRGTEGSSSSSNTNPDNTLIEGKGEANALFAAGPELLHAANELAAPFLNRSVDEQNWIFSAGSKASGIHFHQHADNWVRGVG